MKKFIALLLALIMVFTMIPSIAGPAARAEDPPPTESTAPTESTGPTESPAPTQDPYNVLDPVPPASHPYSSGVITFNDVKHRFDLYNINNVFTVMEYIVGEYGIPDRLVSRADRSYEIKVPIVDYPGYVRSFKNSLDEEEVDMDPDPIVNDLVVMHPAGPERTDIGAGYYSIGYEDTYYGENIYVSIYRKTEFLGYGMIYNFHQDDEISDVLTMLGVVASMAALPEIAFADLITYIGAGYKIYNDALRVDHAGGDPSYNIGEDDLAQYRYSYAVIINNKSNNDRIRYNFVRRVDYVHRVNEKLKTEAFIKPDYNGSSGYFETTPSNAILPNGDEKAFPFGFSIWALTPNYISVAAARLYDLYYDYGYHTENYLDYPPPSEDACTCTICGYTRHERLLCTYSTCWRCGKDIGAKDHTYAWREVVIYDAPGVPMGHERYCTKCGYIDPDPKTKGFHSYDWTYVDENSHISSGVCKVCNIKTTPELQGHSYDYRYAGSLPGLNSCEKYCTASGCGYSADFLNHDFQIEHIDTSESGCHSIVTCKRDCGLNEDKWGHYNYIFDGYCDNCGTLLETNHSWSTTEWIIKSTAGACRQLVWVCASCGLKGDVIQTDSEHAYGNCSDLICNDCGFDRMQPYHPYKFIWEPVGTPSVCQELMARCPDCGDSFHVQYNYIHSYADCQTTYCDACKKDTRGPVLGVLYNDGHVYNDCDDPDCNRCLSKRETGHHDLGEPTIVAVYSDPKVCKNVQGVCDDCGETYTRYTIGHSYINCGDLCCHNTNCYFTRPSVNGVLFDDGHIYTNCKDDLDCAREGCTGTRSPIAHIDSHQPTIVTVGSATVCKEVWGNCDKCRADYKISTTSHWYTDCKATACSNNCGCPARPTVSGYLYSDGHVYNSCTALYCNRCNHKRAAVAHVYTNCVDTTCNKCGAARTAPGHSNPHDVHLHKSTSETWCTKTMGTCSVCGDEYQISIDSTHRYSSSAFYISNTEHYHACLDCIYIKKEGHNKAWTGGFYICTECGQKVY